jgi:hypothetical protein
VSKKNFFFEEEVLLLSEIGCRWSELQIPPLRFAPVGMTKERAMVP